MIGSRLGPYEITAKLGEGGMGEVYRATDTRLERQVAIKVLPAAFTEDKERLARFEREAKLLAQLHHPNIASIFGLEESGGTRALVMELVPGPTLAERLEAGAFSIAESLSTALQIAQALEEAHDKGIVHRDLKPQNVKASSEGKIKVLDFGLAKAMDPTGGVASAADLARSPTIMNSPTLTAVHGTQLGVILGTAAYMSPEQAKGFPVDKRADIWAFGVVLYEMLAGSRLFAGDSVAETLAGVLKTEIDFAELPDEAPPAIRRLLRRCLQRKPHDRLRDIGDARLVIAECLSGTLDERPPTATAIAPAPSVLRKWWLPLAAAVALLAGAFGFLWGAKQATNGGRAPAEQRFAIAAESRSPGDRQAIAPDGSRIAYTAGGALWLRALGEVEPREVAGSEDAREPFWSPDSREVGFVRAGALWRIGIDGGSARRICDLPAGVFDGGTWGEDGMVTFALATGGWTGNLEQCPAAGGNARTFLKPEAVGVRFRRPQALPNGAGVLYVLGGNSSSGELRLFAGGKSRVLLQTPSVIEAAALSSGRRLYFSQIQNPRTDLWAVTLDERLEKPLGEPTLVAQNGDAPSVANDGALLFALVESAPRRLALVRRDGSASPIGEPFSGEVANDVLQLSPEGSRATTALADARGDGNQLWIVELASGTRQRVTTEIRNPLAAWSPDGRELLVTGEAGVDSILPMTGGGAMRPLLSGQAIWQPRYAPDGKWIVAYAITAESGRDIFRIAADGKAPPEPLVREPGQQTNPDVSPDGRFLAYQSDESGRPEIYVRPYPTGGRKWQVSSGGGASPIWNRQGGELVWLAGNSIWSAPVRTAGGDFDAGAPHLVLSGDALGADLSSGAVFYSRTYDLSSDGRTFILAQRASAGRNEMVYVENPGGRGAR